MHIDDILAQVRGHINDTQPEVLQIPDNWTQGRTAFGGLSAAMTYEAIKQKVAKDRSLRSFSCQFIGPLLPNKDFSIEVEVLREGKNVTQALGRIIQKGQITTLCQASFGTTRHSKINVPSATTHSMSLPQKPKFIPQIPKITPKFFQHMEIAIDQGQLPFTKSKKSHVHGWMRLKKSPEEFTDSHLILLIDAWPPAVLQMLRWPAPASSLTWNLDFIHDSPTVKQGEWLAYQVKTRHAADGYAQVEANVWDQNQNLLVLSRQTVTVFD